MLRATFLFLIAAAACIVAQDNLAGAYKGKWNGMSASGDFSLKLENSGGTWKATIEFTLGDNPVPTIVRSVRVDGSKIEATYDFDLGGNKLQSSLQGEIRGGQLTGKYKTKALADGNGVDEGTCDAKRAE